MRMVDALMKFAHHLSWRSFSTRRFSHDLSAGPPARITCSDADACCGARPREMVRVRSRSASSDFIMFVMKIVWIMCGFSRLFISWWLLFWLGRLVQRLHSLRSA